MRLCMEVRQWQQLFGLYTTARIRYRPLSPAASSLSVSFPNAAAHPFFRRRCRRISGFGACTFKCSHQLAPQEDGRDFRCGKSAVLKCSDAEMTRLGSFVLNQLSWDASKGTVAAVMTFLFLYTSILRAHAAVCSQWQ